MAQNCSEVGCTEAPIVRIGETWLCSKHFIQRSYQKLEIISAGLQGAAFSERNAEAAARELEECMRGAADIACSPAPPSNLERARVIDLLLWASELHARLRRSPRVAARIPVLLRSDAPGHPWEEKTETIMISRHGMQVSCRAEIHPGEVLGCVRLDNGRRLEARVAWVRQNSEGGADAGLEFATDDNFWGVDWGTGREAPKA